MRATHGRAKGGSAVTPTSFRGRASGTLGASSPQSFAATAASPPPPPPADHEAGDGGAAQRRGAHAQLVTSARREGQRFRNLVQRPILLGAIGLHLLGLASILLRLAFRDFSLDIFFVSFTCSSLGTAAGLPAVDWQNARRTIHVMLGSCVIVCGLHAYILAAYVQMTAGALRGGAACAVAETSAPAQRAPCAWAHASVVLLAVQTLGFGWMIVRSLFHLCGNAPEHSLAHLFTRSVGHAVRVSGVCALARVVVGVAYGLFAPTMTWVALLLSACAGLLVGQLMLTGPYVSYVRGLFAERGDGVSTAASIAAIIKGSHATKVQALARQHFRGVRICDLTLDALSSNAPDQSATALSRRANLGEVDAFVTHAWSDDPAAKLRGLRGWRSQFMALNKREPLVWIDKFCLDQLDIEDGLACLPVFLAGCDSLLVLAGPTWLERLWCVTEMYVHFEIGRLDDAIELVDLCAPPRGARRQSPARSRTALTTQGIVRKRASTVDTYAEPDADVELVADGSAGDGSHRTLSARDAAALQPRRLHLAREEMHSRLTTRSLPHAPRVTVSTMRTDCDSELALEDAHGAADDEADDATPVRARARSRRGDAAESGELGGELGGERSACCARPDSAASSPRPRNSATSGRAGRDDDSSAQPADGELAQLIEAFDVRQALCTDPQTGVQLMRVIEAGSNSLDLFNEQMRTTLHRARARAHAALMRSKDNSSEWNRSYRSRISTRRMPAVVKPASAQSMPVSPAAPEFASAIARTRAMSNLEPRRSKAAVATWTEGSMGDSGRVSERSQQAEGIHAWGVPDI